MNHSDNWGWKARFGLFIVGVEAVPEAEWWAMAPEGVSVHAARVSDSTPWAAWTDDSRTEVSLKPDTARGAHQFAQMRLDAVVSAHSSSSIVGGDGWDEATQAALRSVVRATTHVSTNGLDCKAALKAVEVERPYVVFPPWFGDEVLERGREYFTHSDLAPADIYRSDPGMGWRELPPNALYAEGLGFEQDVESLYRQIRETCPTDADGVLIAGTGVRCVSIISALEADLGRAVITANQASLWRCLRSCGIYAQIDGYGQLFET